MCTSASAVRVVCALLIDVVGSLGYLSSVLWCVQSCMSTVRTEVRPSLVRPSRTLTATTSEAAQSTRCSPFGVHVIPTRSFVCGDSPWIANCVGYWNYRHFFLYMLYLWLGCLYIVALVVPCLLHVKGDGKGLRGVRVDMSDSVLFFALVVATGGWCGLTGMLAVHGWLVATGQTTIEMYVNGKRAEERKKRAGTTAAAVAGWWPVHEYDVGLRRNVEAMLGRGRWLVSSFLPGGASMVGNGLWYETREDWVDDDTQWLAA